MMKYINEDGLIVNAKEGIRLDANHDLKSHPNMTSNLMKSPGAIFL